MLVPRQPFTFLPAGQLRTGRSGPSPWRRALTGLDQEFLTDNQLSVWSCRDGGGLRAFHFYPLPFPHVFAAGKWSFEEISNHGCLRGLGPRLQVQASRTTMRFQPHLIEKRMRLRGGGAIRERCCVWGPTVLLDWDIDGVATLPVELALPFFAASLSVGGKTRGGPCTFVASIRDELYVAVAIAGLRDCAAGEPAAPAASPRAGFAMELEGKPARGGRVSLAMSVAYGRKAALEASRAAATAPETFVRRAEEAWEAYFGDVVPRFVCSNKKVEQLYYYQAYVHALRERILEAAAILGGDAPPGLDVEAMAAGNARLREAINRWLWDEADGFYYDAHPAINTYGGDSLITSGIWFTIVGLVRYGFRELAARYVARTVEMLTAGGPSSSYSYHSVSGAPNMPRHQLTAQSCIATDLICRYVVGIEPEPTGFRVDPVALGALGIRSLAFGPFRYGDQTLTVRYDARAGHRVEIRPSRPQPGRRARSTARWPRSA